MNDRGTVAPLIASYLALVLLTVFGVSAVGLTMVAANRVQGVADFALLYAHDRSTLAGIPNLVDLEREMEHFLANAQSAQQLRILSLRSWTTGPDSHIEICAQHQNLLGVGLRSAVICKTASAKSYEVPRDFWGH